MSPLAWMVGRETFRFPRVSGDEPGIKTFADGLDGFSPRERG